MTRQIIDLGDTAVSHATYNRALAKVAPILLSSYGAAATNLVLAALERLWPLAQTFELDDPHDAGAAKALETAAMLMQSAKEHPDAFGAEEAIAASALIIAPSIIAIGMRMGKLSVRPRSAACVLIPQTITDASGSKQDVFLCVTRRHDHTKWGLPGGKADGDETALEAACRELAEEVDIIVDEENLLPLYTDVVEGKGADDTFVVTTFLLLLTNLDVGRIQVDMDYEVEEGILAGWKPAEVLVTESSSTFATYNKGVIGAYERLRKVSGRKN